MGTVISVNGKVIQPKSGAISPAGQGFLAGFGLFETMPAYNGRIYLLDRHLARLLDSAATLGIGGMEVERLIKLCTAAAAAAAEEIARVRLTVSRREDGGDEPDIVVVARRYAPPPPSCYRQGGRAAVASIRRCSFSPLMRHKTTSRMECVIAREQAQKEGYDEAIFTNEKGNLSEGSISNIFLIGHGGEVVTPPLAEGILPGIMRRCVIDWAWEMGIGVSENPIPAATLPDFTSAFLTNSMFGILPLAAVKCGDTEYSFQPDRMMTRLIQTWRKSAGLGYIAGLD